VVLVAGDGNPTWRRPRARRRSVVTASHPELGDRWLYCDGAPPLLFTENDTNTERLFGTPNASPYVKDAFHACVVHGNTDAVNPAQVGTKAAAHYRLEVGRASRWQCGCASLMHRRRAVRLRLRETVEPGVARRTNSTDPHARVRQRGHAAR
jgi:hypothetical protein